MAPPMSRRVASHADDDGPEPVAGRVRSASVVSVGVSVDG